MVDDFKNVTLLCSDVITFEEIRGEEAFCTNVEGLIVAYVLPIILVSQWRHFINVFIGYLADSNEILIDRMVT